MRLWVLALSLCMMGAARAETVHDASLGMTLTLPSGFADFPPGRQQPDTRHSWIRGEAGSADFAILGIDAMGGTIGRERLKPSEVPVGDGFTFELRQEKWKGFDVEVFAGHASTDEAKLFVLVAQVPLLPQAIQVKLVGPAAKEKELTALLRTVLASLDGKTNWLTGTERVIKLIEGGGWMIFVLVILGGGALFRKKLRA